jgi:hypothetical protein
MRNDADDLRDIVNLDARFMQLCFTTAVLTAAARDAWEYRIITRFSTDPIGCSTLNASGSPILVCNPTQSLSPTQNRLKTSWPQRSPI